VLGGWLVSAALAALAGIVIFVSEIANDPNLWGNSTHRLVHPLGNPNFMAGFLITPTLVAVAAALMAVFPNRAASVSERTTAGASGGFEILPLRLLTRPLKAVLFAGLGVFLFAALLMTGSRGGCVGLLAGAFALVLMQLRKRGRRIALAGAAVVLAVAILVLALTPSSRRWGSDPASSGTVKVRLALWNDAARMILARPLVGWGAGGFSAFHATVKLPGEHREYYLRRSAISPHNEFLEYGVEYGVLGMALYIAFVVGLIVWTATRMQRARSPLALKAVLAGFVGLNAHSGFDVGLRFWDLAPFFWLTVGMLFVLGGEAESQAAASAAPLDQEPPAEAVPSAATGFAIVTGLLGAAWCVTGVVDLVGQVDLHSGQHAKEAQQWGRAGAAYTAALGKALYFPDRVSARLFLSDCQRREGRIPQAIATLEELKQYAPNESWTNIQLGLLYMQAADQLAATPEQRNELLNSAVAAIGLYLQTNEDPRGYIGLARVYLRQTPCRFAEAVAALQNYQSLLRADGKTWPPSNAKASVFRANAGPMDYLELVALWVAAKDKAQALQVLQMAAKRFPNDPAISQVTKLFQGKEDGR
jgi:O-antigen ligase